MPALDVIDRAALGEGLVLVVDRDFLAPLRAAVVVVGREMPQVRLEGRLLDPPVEPDQLRPVLLDQLGGPRQPVVQVRLQGACAGCPSSSVTLKLGIEARLKDEIPEVRSVVAL